MTKKNKWETFFDHHAPEYMKNSFTKTTKKEVKFLVKELDLEKGNSILDVGCGTGRHSVLLAKKGYEMTCLDQSQGMLDQAKKAAEKENVNLNLVKADATSFKINKKFNAAICLCEGAFGLLSSSDNPEKHDLKILQNINAALKPKAKLIMNALNGLQKIRQFDKEDIKKGKFNPMTLVETCTMDYKTEKGKKKIKLREKAYTPLEIKLLLNKAGFEVEHIFGGTAGNWRKESVDPDEIEILIVAHKK